MTLDAYPGDDAIKRMLDDRTQNASPRPVERNGVALGPDSPLRGQRSGPKGDTSSRRRPREVEHEIQVALFAWVDDPETLLKHPELAAYHAIPNGGKRALAVAAKLKAEGVKPGVLDTHLPVARGEYHSLYIEIKKPGGTLSPEQAHWLAALARYGNRVAIHASWEGARDELLNYLALPTP